MEDNDAFVFNEGFSAPLYRIKVQSYDAVIRSLCLQEKIWNVDDS